MPSIAHALEEGRIDVLLLLGTNTLSSFADAGAMERGLARTGLVVALDIFSSETIRRAADIVLPGTVWLEELGIKDTATHVYLMERALPAAGEARPVIEVLRELAVRLAVPGFFPWADVEGYVDAWLAPQRGAEGEPLTVARLRTSEGRAERAGLSHVAYPDRRFHTPSQGRALPALARLEREPELWVHPLDAADRALGDGADAMVFNDGGELRVRVRVTEDVRPGVVWLRDGWFGLNHLTSGAGALDAAQVDLVDAARIPGGQSAFEARVELRAA
jgi:anaerobic selenocysteine-containing dehydrogenase